MKTYTTVSCFKCGKSLENLEYPMVKQDRYVYVHPMGGVHFAAHGHYGSSVFDPMDGTSLDIAICDECVVEHKHLIRGNGVTNLGR